MIRPFILRWIIDKYIPAGDIHGAVVCGLFFILCLAVGAGMSYLQVVVLARAGAEIIRTLKHRVFTHVVSQGMRFFDKNQTGKLLSRTESDVDKLEALFTNMTGMLISTGFMLFGIVGVIFWEQPVLGIWILFLAPVLIVLFYIYLSYMVKLFTRVREKNAELTGYIAEYVQGVPLLQLYSKKDVAGRLLMDKQKDKYDLEVKSQFLEYGIFWACFDMISEVLVLIGLFAYSLKRIYAGQMSVGTMVMYLELMRQFFGPLRGLMHTLSQLQSSVAAGRRLFDLLDNPPDVIDDLTCGDKIKLTDRIDFQNVTFAYDKEAVLKNVNFSVKKGEHIAIVGASGSGKTTCINLLLRFYDSQSGTITIDGQDHRKFQLCELRRDISLVLQEIYLFPGTIMENLRFFDQSLPEERVIDAAKLLGAHEFIMKKPDGYKTYLSERGGNLSQGERQLLSFTRALVKDPDILILDEATSSVDVITEHFLQESLKKLMEGRTAIIIAHRLSTVKSADKILVFENGGIVESGRHDELMGKDGVYRRLSLIQAVEGQ